MAKRKSLLNRIHVSPFNAGIHENVVISKIDIKDRKRNGVASKKFLFITFAKLDENNKKVAENEVGWWKLDVSSEMFYTNMQNFCLQLDNILQLHYSEEEVDNIMADVFDEFEFSSLEEIKTHKWKQKEANLLMDNLASNFYAAMQDYIGINSPAFRIKLPFDNRGERVEIPRYGAFVEPMTVDPTKLSFSDFELKNANFSGKKVNAATTPGL